VSSIRTLVSELHTWEWLAILLARLAVGLLFFLSGRGKLFVPERREEMRRTLVAAHVPLPDFYLRLHRGIRLRLVSRARLRNPSRLRDARRRDDSGDRDYRDQKYQSDVSARLSGFSCPAPVHSALIT
jgi:hypothetical protein